MKRFLNILIFLFICTVGHATHNRAGQILYKHISGYTYEFTETSFYTTLNADGTPNQATLQRIRDGLTVEWGDNTTSTIPSVRQEIEILPDNFTKVNFRMQHTFPGPGAYTIIMADPNRNEGVLNIPNSVNVVFSIKTILWINPNTGHNNAPEFLTYPIDKAAVGQRFVHNPSAFDIDGDSLSYELSVCSRERGIEIETYSFPEAMKELYVDAITGDFVWDAPVKAGLYNVAMRVNEWRYGVKIGSIVRDMQIEVVNSNNRPPVLPTFRDTCVIAGAKIEIPVNVTDPDNDLIILTATGGPFQAPISPAIYPLPIDDEGPGFTNATFIWQTDNSHVRRLPYTVVFKAEDQNGEVKLVSFANYNITVIAPEVENLTAMPDRKEILLEWNPTVCDHASGYEIFRSIGSFDFDLGICETGIPSGLGYEKVATLDGIDNTVYRDNNNGRGLSPGIEYCYRVVAIFADGAKSLPSGESCASLLAGTPPMIRAHVETVAVAGEIHVAWIEKPVKELIAEKPGIFEYRLFYTLDMDIGNWIWLTTKNLGDTTYIHAPIDTKTAYPYYYKAELWDSDTNTIVDEDFEIASSLYPILQASDHSVVINFGRYSPWVNEIYEIYRCNNTGKDICVAAEWVGRTNREIYTDTNLKNGQEYCYRIESKGYRYIDGIKYGNENWSHVACVTPFDNVPPCPPEITGESICEENKNQLDWTYDPICMYDVEKYRIYFTPDPARQAYAKVDSVMSRDIYTFSHYGTLKGCYYVTAVDSAGNQSRESNVVCLDECGEYDLPNVFTPNGDNINDVFKSFNPGGVTKVDMKIYNRLGKLVFKTEDSDINWDGRDIDSKRFVSSGVYYYICEVYEERINGGIKIVPMSGFIHVYYGDGAQPFVPPIE